MSRTARRWSPEEEQIIVNWTEANPEKKLSVTNGIPGELKADLPNRTNDAIYNKWHIFQGKLASGDNPEDPLTEFRRSIIRSSMATIDRLTKENAELREARDKPKKPKKPGFFARLFRRKK